MPRPAAPLWLTAPSRFATLRYAQARGVLVALALLLALCLTALAPGAAPRLSTGPGQTDLELYEHIAAGVRGGGDYYRVTAKALREGDYPLRPFVTFRLPTLALLQAALPAALLRALLYTLCLGVILAWAVRLREGVARALPWVAGLLLLLAGMTANLQVELAGFHEIWAGLLIALSLALYRPDQWRDAVAFALMAMLLRETAALYVLIMAALAWMSGARREALGWAAALGVFALVIMAHAWAVSRVVTITDPASPGWSGLLGPGFFVRTMTMSTALAAAPLWLGAMLVGLALFGWASWRDPLALRVLAVLAGYAVLISLFGRADTFYWGLMAAPLLPLGLVFAPDGLRDLAAAAMDRRRITVTRLRR
ncbi:hypothetical protein [Sphingomonas sp.]|uniref:hypothetical protein n=1 Tax=Sphingomonas sp. TaxID=28214 RepID=UPI001D75400A|nr:hypothetical protein [Sphingomonas sp.]MBX9797373.1 hypothetical protein [Sphingomonas sp.]